MGKILTGNLVPGLLCLAVGFGFMHEPPTTLDHLCVFIGFVNLFIWSISSDKEGN